MRNDDFFVDLVIPIYNLRKHRYNNFCYLIQQISKIQTHSLGCNVVVCEQSSKHTANVEVFLTKYTNIKHHIVEEGGDLFNKSSVINHAFNNTHSEFFWMCDCDLIFNFEHVIKNLDISSDFIKPFEYVTLLDEHQTEYYMTHNRLMNIKRKYITNSCTGKYSFIVRRSVFDQVGKMNEDFEGWGFQDLDFAENRMKQYKPNIISGIAHHMYHPPASRLSADRNRRLYMNLGGVTEPKETSTELPTEKVDKPEPKPVSVVEAPPTRDVQPIQQIQTTTETINWSEVSKHIVCHRVNKNDVFNINEKSQTVYNESWSTTTTRSVLNRNDIKHHTTHYLHWYLNYIVSNYNNQLSDITIFLTDAFLRTKIQLETPNYKTIRRFLTTGIADTSKLYFIAGKLKYRTAEDGHFTGTYNKRSMYTYTNWCDKYLIDNKNPRNINTAPMSGCIMVPRESVYKRSYEFYNNLLNQTKSWTVEDYAYCSASLDRLFP